MGKLTKKYAKQLAETITSEELLVMLERAKNNVPDWTVPSRCNKGISRGINWNFFCKDFSITEEYESIHKYRMLEEFGEYLDDNMKQPRVVTRKNKPPTHFSPEFDNFNKK